MMIARDNYEPFFMDYLDGNLEESRIDEFLDFLDQNPDLKEELHLFEKIHLPDDHVVFTGKKNLYKSGVKEKGAFEIKTIAFMEGDLRDEERKSFEAHFASDPKLQKDYDLFAKTRLMADTVIKYPYKQDLYKKSRTAILLNWATRAAAVIILIWGIYSLIENGNQITSPALNQEIASVKPQPVAPNKNIESIVNSRKTESSEILTGKAKAKSQTNHKITTVSPKIKPTVNSNDFEKNLTVLEKINPLVAYFEIESFENQLAVSHSVNIEPMNDPRNVMTLDEFLASRMKKVGGKGLFSANRIIRTGLNVASELSGNRIGYRVKNGKIASLEFESKLMAFKIPLEKK